MLAAWRVPIPSMMSSEQTQTDPTTDAIAGCLIGAAVADAIGLPYEGLSPRRAVRLFPNLDRHHFFLGRGMFSDDTEHAILVGQALLACHGEIKRYPLALATRLKRWFFGMPAGIGLATLKSCIRLWIGFSPRSSGVFSAGNGPCMRAPLLGVMYGNQPELLEQFLKITTEITHTDPKALWASRTIAQAAWQSYLHRHNQLDHNHLRQSFCDAVPHEGAEFRLLLEQVFDSLEKNETTEEFAHRLMRGKGVSGYVFHTVPVVLHAWLRFPKDFLSTITTLIRCGGDVDTTCAIAGSIVGCAVGPNGIPEQWQAKMAEWPRNILWLKKLAHRLGVMLTDKNSPTSMLKANPSGILARNLLFMCVVLFHGFRRMFPPY
ncbi:MAG: ADP-ribosylglycohydrolase family protein [Zavarzinella sp.]